MRIAIVGGRVIDPETGLDAIRTVVVEGDRIASITTDAVEADRTIDASGLVVAPGFIDLHSHAQTIAGARLQALDGVTTALELEGGALPVAETYAQAEREGRAINFGFSSSWALARLSVVAGTSWSATAGETPIEVFEEEQAHPRWNTPASASELEGILREIEAGLDEGGIGVGVLLGYAPGSHPDEFRRVAELAARRGVPVFAHSRAISMVEPGSSIEAIREIVGVAESTGAHVHVCHLNSTSLRLIDEIREEVLAARARGVRLSTETYPYGAGSTGIGASFFAPEEFHRLGAPTTAIQYLPTGEHVASLERLAELRATDPGGLCIFEYLDPARPEDLRLLLQSFTMPDGIIASDAMPLTLPAGQRVTDEWPLPAEAQAHPRSAGTFARTLRWLVRELGVFDLAEGIRRISFEPARLLEQSVPAMRGKGRLQVGADADIVVFDPETVTDTATFEVLSPSTGIQYVLVGGQFVVVDGQLDTSARPGRAVRVAQGQTL